MTLMCRKPTISIASALRIVRSVEIMIAHGGRNGQMALILKIALIVFGVTLGLSIFDVIVVGLVYLARVGIEKKQRKRGRRMNEGSKCQWVCTCPYYESQTSYGTEVIKCANTDCALYEVYREREEEE